MADIKPAGRSADKWTRQSAAARTEYEQGVKSTNKDWKTNTLAAAGNYETGVTAAIGEKRFQGGVDKAGTTKWRDNTLAKGPNRWTEGIAGAKDNYTKGFAPYHSAIAALDLPPRGPKGSPQNLDRVRVIAERLHQVKLDQAKG